MQDVLIDRDHYVRRVSERIHSLTSDLISQAKEPLDFHNTLQRKVTELGSEFGFRGLREYPVRSLDADIQGLADVVWMAGRRLATVFEIDSSPKAKSVKKLLALEAPFRFWVYYGHQHYLSMVRSIDRKGAVDVIKLRDVYF